MDISIQEAPQDEDGCSATSPASSEARSFLSALFPCERKCTPRSVKRARPRSSSTQSGDFDRCDSVTGLPKKSFEKEYLDCVMAGHFKYQPKYSDEKVVGHLDSAKCFGAMPVLSKCDDYPLKWGAF